MLLSSKMTHCSKKCRPVCYDVGYSEHSTQIKKIK